MIHKACVGELHKKKQEENRKRKIYKATWKDVNICQKIGVQEKSWGDLSSIFRLIK